MTFIVALVVGVICLGIGFVGGKLYTEKNFNKAELTAQIEDSHQQMEKLKEDVTANLGVTQKLMNDMKANYDSIVEQMHHTTKLLEQSTNNNEPSMPYFSSDTSDHLATLGDNERKRKTEGLLSQPSDYSDGSSGLFNNKQQDENNANETAKV